MVNGIPLTCREMEVIAYILNGRGEKKIGAILSMDERAVSSHTSNIRRKLGCNSRESIIDFIEKSDKSALIKNEYYQSLNNRSSFEIQLNKIHFPSTSDLEPVCFIVDWKEQSHQGSEAHKLKNHLKKQLIKHLEMTPIKLGKSPIKECERLEHLKHELDSAHRNYHAVSIVSTSQLTHILAQENKQEPIACFPITFIILDEETKAPVPQEAKGANQINIFDFQDYYLFVLSILINLFPSIVIDTIKINFTNRRDKEGESEQKVLKADQGILLDGTKGVTITYFLKSKMKQALMFIALAMGLCCSYYLFFIFRTNNPGKIMHIGITQEQQEIRSDLLIPSEPVLLNRVDLITQISDKFKQKQESIVTIALIGIGGSGKTTLARQYARSQPLNVVWEINAETKETLENSFENLAASLAITDKEKMELKGLQDVTNHEARKEKVIQLVKKILRSQQNWFLIYDNVEQFSDIQKYFPADPKGWGKGAIIITSRDANIANNNHVHHTIPVGELSEKEKTNLFISIMSHGDSRVLNPIQRRLAQSFLTKIPSFPLDITTAAHYLKITNISYKKYLKYLEADDKDFENTQKDILKETTDYDKTRHKIIMLALKKLLQENDKFEKLLFFIGLIDSQNIPKQLLEAYKIDTVVSSFMYNLKKYSLIKIETPKSFSIHRSIQEVILNYFDSLLNENDKNKIINNIISNISIIFDDNLRKDCHVVISLIPHLESMLRKLKGINLSDVIRNKYKEELLLRLGYAHYKCTRNLILAKKNLLKIINNSSNRLNNKLPFILKDLGDISVDLNETDEAIRYCKESINLLKKPNNITEAENFKIIGYSYCGKNDFVNSEYYLKKALAKLYDSENDELKIDLESEVYGRLAALYSLTYLHGTRANEAEKYIYKSLENFNLPKSINEVTKKLSCQVAKNKMRVGHIYCRMGKYHNALKNGFEEAQYIIDNKLDSCSHNFSKALILLGKGIVSLRIGSVNTAEQQLTASIQLLENLLGNSFDILLARIFRAEAYIRLGKIMEANSDCSIVMNTKKIWKNNYIDLMFLTCLYHAAIIEYKKMNIEKSLHYFSQFINHSNEFCKSFLDKKFYNDLERTGSFIVILDKNLNKNIATYLQRSIKIFSSIYSLSHPFVNDYILENLNSYISSG